MRARRTSKPPPSTVMAESGGSAFPGSMKRPLRDWIRFFVEAKGSGTRRFPIRRMMSGLFGDELPAGEPSAHRCVAILKTPSVTKNTMSGGGRRGPRGGANRLLRWSMVCRRLRALRTPRGRHQRAGSGGVALRLFPLDYRVCRRLSGASGFRNPRIRDPRSGDPRSSGARGLTI